MLSCLRRLLLCCLTGLWFCVAELETRTSNVHVKHSVDHLRVPKKYCDPTYNNHTSGAHTQSCASGQYRVRQGPYKGQCVPCNCNGLSNRCDPNTGICLECHMNTAGPHCERCAPGYYGNAVLRTCRVCPCPFSHPNQSFALGCMHVGDDVECVCKSGYTGDRCERCAAGYYGNPLAVGGHCHPCDCDDGDYCDPLTGNCGNPHEPSTDEDCQECDSCVQTLADDLEVMDSKLFTLKVRLQQYTEHSASLTALQTLEDAIHAAMSTVIKYSTSVQLLNLKVTELDTDMDSVTHDLSSLSMKADWTFLGTNEFLKDLYKTQQKGTELLTDAEELLKKIEDLLEKQKMNQTDSTALDENVMMRMKEEAQQMVGKMQRQNCELQRRLAEEEFEEANRLFDFILRNLTGALSDPQVMVKDLTLLNTGLTGLENSLKNAENSVMKIKLINDRDEVTLRDITKRRQMLEIQKDNITAAFTLTDKLMTDTTAIHKILTDLQNDYAKLAAELDGAKTAINQRLDEVSAADALHDMVRKAEEHAQDLLNLAMHLQMSALNFTNTSVVYKTVESIKAYGDVIDALLKAEAAASDAGHAAEKALQDAKIQNLTQMAEQFKNSADILEDNAMKTENRLKDDIGTLMNQTKTVIQTANSMVHNATTRHKNMREGLEMINITIGDSDVSNILNSANITLKILNESISTLTDALSKVENQTGLLHNITNMSDSITRIKDMIETTRDMANSIRGPILFSGDSHVEVRPPKNLVNLQAFTALNLTLHRPKASGGEDGARRRRQDGTEDNLFVLYLGNKKVLRDYVALVVRDSVLYCMYKLGGIIHEIKTREISRSSPDSAFMDRVDFRRIYQDAEVIYTQTFTSAEPRTLPPISSRANTTVSLLELDPDDLVLYVGGYPNDFTPPVELQYPSFRGCIEFSTFNEHILGLYNFRHAVNIKNTDRCLRGEVLQEVRYFDGTGFGRFNINNSRFLKFDIRTRQENAMLLFMRHEDSHVSITVQRGYVVLQTKHGDQTVTERSKVQVFPTDNYQPIQIVQSSSQTEVNVTAVSVIVWVNYSIYTEAFIGGVPAETTVRFPAFRGCLQSLKMGINILFTEVAGVVRGCPAALLGEHEAALPAGSFLSVSPRGGQTDRGTTVSLGFKSTQSSGPLLHTGNVSGEFELSLHDGHVEMKSSMGILKSKNRYDEGKWHYVTAFRNSTGMELSVDNTDAGQRQVAHSSIPAQSTEVVLGGGTFRGCLTDFYMRSLQNNYIPADLSSFSHSGAPSLGSCDTQHPSLKKRGHVKWHNLKKSNHRPICCHVQSQSPSTVLATGEFLATQESSTADFIEVVAHSQHSSDTDMSYSEQNCSGAGAVGLVRAFHLSHSSQLHFFIPAKDLNYRPHFSLDVRSLSTDGLLLHVADRRGQAAVVLFMADGKVKLSVGKGGLISYHKKINNGDWHNIKFSVEQHTIHMVVDGFRVPDGQLKENEGISLALQSPVYIGTGQLQTTSQIQSTPLPQTSVVGCVRDVRFYDVLIEGPVVNHGGAPCFHGGLVPGAYFAGEGSHAVLEKFFKLGNKFDFSFKVQPRSSSGLILHSRGHHGNCLSIFLMKGVMVVEISDGAEHYNISVTPSQPLCDDSFHRVSVSRNGSVITLKVDQNSKHTVLPYVHTHFQTLNTLYIGGVPESERNSVPIWSSYVGCVKNVRINQAAVSFASVTSIFGPVNIHSCPAH